MRDVCSRQFFPVENCTSFCPGSMTIFGEKRAFCVDYEATSEKLAYSECGCIRPYFPLDGQCTSAFEIVGLGWLVPILTTESFLQLYNISYTIWIIVTKVRAQSHRSCTFVLLGAFCILGMELTRLLRLIDPYHIYEDTPDSAIYVLGYFSNALLMLALCFVFLSVNKAVHTQSATYKVAARNWPKCVIISMTAVGVVVNLGRHVVILVVRASGGDRYEGSLDLAFNGVNLVVLVSSFVLMSIEARMLHLRLVDFSKTFTDRRSQAGAISKLSDLVTMLKRYFYPTMACGFFVLVIFLVYNLCLGDLGPIPYIASWAVINTLQSSTTLLMLFILEGNTVSAFPCRTFPCFRTCAEELDSCCVPPTI